MTDLFIDTKMEFIKRHEEKFLLRQLGATYSFIGKRFDISANRVMQILWKRERLVVSVSKRADNRLIIFEETRHLLPYLPSWCKENGVTFNDQ